MTNGAGYRSQRLVGRSEAEAEVVHGVNETGAVARVRVHEVEKAGVDPCEADVSHARQ